MLILTIDADWSPPEIINPVLEKLDNLGIRSTVFCTDYKPLKGNEPWPLVEYAIHPNFMKDSTQGSSHVEILDNLKAMLPESVGVRTHRLFWYTDLGNLFENYDLKYDSSIFMPLVQNIQPFQISNGNLIRFPIFWTEQLAMRDNLSDNPNEIPNIKTPGLKVFLFHPIYIQGEFSFFFDSFCDFILNKQGNTYTLSDLIRLEWI